MIVVVHSFVADSSLLDCCDLVVFLCCCFSSALYLQVGNRLGFWGGLSCFVSFIWCQLFAWLIARYTNGRDWGTASKSARLNCTNLTHFRLTAGRFRGNSCIVCFGLLVSCYSLLQYSRPAYTFNEQSKMETALTPQTDVISEKVTWLMENGQAGVTYTRMYYVPSQDGY